jgi:hypothetical protein
MVCCCVGRCQGRAHSHIAERAGNPRDFARGALVRRIRDNANKSKGRRKSQSEKVGRFSNTWASLYAFLRITSTCQAREALRRRNPRTWADARIVAD